MELNQARCEQLLKLQKVDLDALDVYHKEDSFKCKDVRSSSQYHLKANASKRNAPVSDVVRL